MSTTDSYSSGFRPEPPRRSMNYGDERRESSDSKKLIVGKDIHLNGEISSCERLVVEGRVDATLSDGRFIEIAKGGLFKGTADVDEAEIRGAYEGKLTVRRRLFICATGRVSGEIEYGEVEIERGGELSGSVRRTIEDKAPRGPTPLA